MKQKYLLGVLLFLGFFSCQDKDAFVDSPITRAIVNEVNVSISNPDLIDNWENIDEILLNTPGDTVTAPWCDGATTHLPSNFRKDIKKEDGWKILFHTFKKVGLDKKQNYICFYNQFTGYIKIFYYYEGSAKSQGTQWFVRTGNGEKTHLFSLANYIAKSDTAKAEANEILCSNMTGVPTDGIDIGWNGFEFEVPYCTDYKGLDFILGAYDQNITNYNYVGKVNSEIVGTITTKSNVTPGIVNAIANLVGNGAKKYIDSISSKVNLGAKLVGLISSIPGTGYAKAISSGLGLIFGKTTVTTSDVKLTASGAITLGGVGTSQTTADIPPISFNLYNIMNPYITSGTNNSLVYETNISNENEHYVGVWKVDNNPRIIYSRYSTVYDFYKHGDSTIDYIEGKVLRPEIVSCNFYITLNPDLESFLVKRGESYTLFRCDTLQGKPFKEGIKDVGKYLTFPYTEASLLYRDEYNSFYEAENITKEMIVDGYVLKSYMDYDIYRYYYDWGIILSGRLLSLLTTDLSFSYLGKNITVVQSRICDVTYGYDASYVEEYSSWYNNQVMGNAVINDKRPAFGIFMAE